MNRQFAENTGCKPNTRKDAHVASASHKGGHSQVLANPGTAGSLPWTVRGQTDMTSWANVLATSAEFTGSSLFLAATWLLSIGSFVGMARSRGLAGTHRCPPPWDRWLSAFCRQLSCH